MRLFLYYSLHTTWNQLRKLFRTWLFLLVLSVLLGGGLIGLGAMRFSSRLQSEDNTVADVLPEDFMEFFDASGITKADAAELGAGLLILAVFSLQVITAEKSVSRLFLPADVNFLFASDMTPQQVLSFRVMSTLGTAFVASIYLFFQLPSLVKWLGISRFGAAALLVVWCLTILWGMLLKICTYEVTASRPVLRRNLRYIVFGILGLAALGLYYSYRTSQEQVFLLSAHRFFNAPLTRFIPVWGWLKGMLYAALTGSTETAWTYFGLSCITAAAVGLLLRKLPADFYEEALIRSEEVALYMESVNRENAGLLVMPSRHYRDWISRQTMSGGIGPSVYFWRPLNSRKRFARLGLFSKTMITYLFTAAAGGLFVKGFMDEPSIYPPMFLLAVVVFFRTVASPMSEDIRRDAFTLIPENTWLKLLHSLLGGTVCCAMDAAIPLMCAAGFAGFFPLKGLLFLPFIVSIDLFATTVGTFVDVAIPSSVDKSLKQVIQILFLYFGMIPDEMIIAFGFISRRAVSCIVLAALINVLLAAVFFGLAGVWLDPAPGKAARFKGWHVDLREAESAYNRIALALAAMFAVTFAAQILFTRLSVSISDSSLLYTLALYMPIYGLGLPVFGLLTRHMHTVSSQQKAMTLKKFLICLSVCFPLMYAGSAVGLIVNGMVSRLLPIPRLEPVPSGELLAPLSVFCLTVLSPLMEELVFRKAIIDRLRPYGEKAALFSSALLFGFFHASFQQFFYAAMLGVVFGYIYLRTGRLRYTVFLHMIINLLGSAIAPAILGFVLNSLPETGIHHLGTMELLSIPAITLFLCYILVLVLISLFGLVMLAYHVKHCRISADSVSMRFVLSCSAVTGFLVLMLGMSVFMAQL